MYMMFSLTPTTMHVWDSVIFHSNAIAKMHTESLRMDSSIKECYAQDPSLVSNCPNPFAIQLFPAQDVIAIWSAYRVEDPSWWPSCALVVKGGHW